MRTLQDVALFVSTQAHLVELLRAVEALALADAWIGAGTIRNAVWDRLHAYSPSGPTDSDVDVVYYDTHQATASRDQAIEAHLREMMPGAPWEVRNQARMHAQNNDPPYLSTEDAMRHWPDTATAIAARHDNGQIEMIAPFGVDDLLRLVVRPTPAFSAKPAQYCKRLSTKNWAERWPQLKFAPS